jgi:hypothetical protein
MIPTKPETPPPSRLEVVERQMVAFRAELDSIKSALAASWSFAADAKGTELEAMAAATAEELARLARVVALFDEPAPEERRLEYLESCQRDGAQSLDDAFTILAALAAFVGAPSWRETDGKLEPAAGWAARIRAAASEARP